MPAISTPCTKVCVIDRASNLCEGCGRTIAEIADWVRMSEAERSSLMAELPARLAALREQAAPDPRRRRA